MEDFVIGGMVHDLLLKGDDGVGSKGGQRNHGAKNVHQRRPTAGQRFEPLDCDLVHGWTDERTLGSWRILKEVQHCSAPTCCFRWMVVVSVHLVFSSPSSPVIAC